MNAVFIPGGEGFVTWLFKANWQASVLIVFILLIRFAFRKQSASKWIYLCWFAVMLRLCLPVSLESGASLFNYVPSPQKQARPSSDTIKETANLTDDQHAVTGKAMNTPATSPLVESSAPLPHSESSRNASPTKNGAPKNSPRQASSNQKFSPWILPILWLTGFTVMLARFVYQNLRFRRQFQGATRVQDPTILQSLDRCLKRLNLKKRPTILEDNAVSTPLLAGLFEPRILISESMRRRCSKEEWDHVLLHELIHLKRKDLWVKWMAALIQCVHWFNPLVWLGFRFMNKDREIATDEAVLLELNPQERLGYGETIVNLVERDFLRTGVPGAVGIAEEKREIFNRLKRIAGFRPSRRAAIFAGAVVLLVAVAGLTDPKPSQPILVLRALKKSDSAPMQNVNVKVQFYGDGKLGESFSRTDKNGEFRIGNAPEEFRLMAVYLFHEEFVPKYIRFRNYETNGQTYETRMEEGRLAGGRVVDEDGQPVAWAKLEPDDQGLDFEKKENIVFMPDLANVFTDQNGYWECRYVPSAFNVMNFYVTAPQYAMGRLRLKREEFGRTDSTFILKRGVDISGRIMDEQGEPLANARAEQVHGYGFDELKTSTDEEGRFVFEHFNPEMTFGDPFKLAVSADGYAPAYRTVPLEELERFVEIRLSESPGLKLKIVDENGRPIEGVHMTQATSIPERKIPWSNHSDAQGMIDWASAPLESVRFSFRKSGYHIKEMEIEPGRHLRTIELRKQPGTATLEITGVVKDAETGTTISQFIVLALESANPFNFSEDFEIVSSGADGRFRYHKELPVRTIEELRNKSQPWKTMLRIQAEDYQPADVELAITDFDEKTKLSVELVKGKSIKGVVLTPSGEPAPYASVALSPLNGLSFYSSSYKPHNHLVATETDLDGEFTLPADPKADAIVAWNQDGIGEAILENFGSDRDLQLKPWGRIEGTLDSFLAPVSNQNVSLEKQNIQKDNGERSRVFFSTSTTTDEAGGFSFKNIPPGQYRLKHVVSARRRSGGTPIGFMHRKTIEVLPDRTATTTFGDQGAVVKGRLNIPDYEGQVDWQWDIHRLMPRLEDPPEFPTPRREDFNSLVEYEKAKEKMKEQSLEWRFSSEGQQYYNSSTGWGLLCKEDGSFVSEGVPPGTYDLKIQITKPTINSVRNDPLGDSGAETIAEKELVVEIPPDARDGQVLDLGTIHLETKEE